MEVDNNEKNKGSAGTGNGVALCFAVSAYALTAPRDTQGSISDNASDEPFSELPANEDIFVNSFTDYPDIDAVKQAAHTAYADNEAKKIDFVNGILQAVCNQSDSVNRIYSKEMGIWVPSAMPENLQISKIRIANSRGMIFIAFNDERGKSCRGAFVLFTATALMSSKKSLKATALIITVSAILSTVILPLWAKYSALSPHYRMSCKQNVQWLQNGRHYKMRIYNGSYTEQELLDMCSLTG